LGVLPSFVRLLRAVLKNRRASWCACAVGSPALRAGLATAMLIWATSERFASSAGSDEEEHPSTTHQAGTTSVNRWSAASPRGRAHSCAGISRHEEGDESSLHRRSSDLRWPRVMRWRSRGCRRSVGRGRAGWAIEPRNQCDRGADAVNGSGRQHRWRRYREPLVDSARSENLGMYADPHAREPGGPMTARQWRWLPAAGREGNAEAVMP